MWGPCEEFIGASHETAEPFGSFDFDGVLGLALGGMTQGRTFMLMDRMEVGRAVPQRLVRQRGT